MPRSRHRVRQANDGAPVQARRGNLSELRLLQSNRAKSKVHENRINSYKCCRPKVETPHRVALIYGQLNEVLDWLFGCFFKWYFKYGIYKWHTKMGCRKVKSYVQDILWECHKWTVQQMVFKNVGNPV